MAKAKGAAPDIFSRTSRTIPNTSLVIPKFAVLSGDDWSLPALGAAIGRTVTDCNGDVYAGDNMCSGSHRAVYSTPTGYAADIEGVRTDVTFAAGVEGTITDPFGAVSRCRPGLGTILCDWPDDIGYQIAVDGRSRVWHHVSASYGADSAILAAACVVAFALLLDRSTRTTAAACGYHVELSFGTRWAPLYRDLVVAILWITTVTLVEYEAQHLLHHTTGTLIERDDDRNALGAFAFTILATNGVVSTLTMTRKVEPIVCRTTYETFLLLAVIVLTPVSVAPLFHALFEAAIGASLVYINTRDWVLTRTGSRPPLVTIAIAVIVIANTLVATLLMLPAMIDCDAIPANAEPYMAGVTTVQIAVAAMISV